MQLDEAEIREAALHYEGFALNLNALDPARRTHKIAFEICCSKVTERVRSADPDGFSRSTAPQVRDALIRNCKRFLRERNP